MAEKTAAERPHAREPAPAPALGDAGASIDPAVQKAIADREIAILNGDSGEVAAATARLAELGVA